LTGTDVDCPGNPGIARFNLSRKKIAGREILTEKGNTATRMKRIYYSLYDRLLNKQKLYEAFRKVRSAKGAAGIDGQSINDFKERITEELEILVNELREKRYQPRAVRRVEIPKPGGGIRKLGIPAVRDRVVQQALLEIMSPIYEEDFHPSSYGYRPGRSCHQAITKARMFIRDYELKWVVDMDLSKCFDTLDHELIIKSVRKRITARSILGLIRQFLESGVMTENGFEKSTTGSPQGGVISPLLANIYLNEFDQYTMQKNYRIIRYADDILILCRSKRGAQKAMKRSVEFLEKKMRLKVNQEKTHMIHASQGVKFLGVKIYTNYTIIQEKKLKTFKEKVKRITRRNSPVNLERVIGELNLVIRGFGYYFRIANCKKVFERLMSWIRRRLRAKQLTLWKKPQRLHRRLRQLGYRGEFKKIRMQSWRNAASPLASMALPNDYFQKIGLFNLQNLQTGIAVPTRG
jgi:RNA-directed DNA polymerase